MRKCPMCNEYSLMTIGEHSSKDKNILYLKCDCGYIEEYNKEIVVYASD